MAMPRKVERNRRLVGLREKDPEKYSWKVLGREFGISFITAREIYLKYRDEFIPRSVSS